MTAASDRPHVSLRVRVARERAEWAAAEAWAAGATGIEEREAEPSGVVLIVYAPPERADAVHRALVAVVGTLGRVDAPRDVETVDWPETWKEGLEPVVVSERLVVRPPFAATALAPGQREVVIEPRQAFGTGAHATTLLALELIDRCVSESPPARMIDVGCGSGVLALAGLVLGAGRALACDLDPLATRETCENARAAGVAARLDVLLGSTGAIGAGAFQLVAANLIRSELMPVLDDLVRLAAPGARLVLSGLLASERTRVEGELERRGLQVERAQTRPDRGGDVWLGLLTRT